MQATARLWRTEKDGELVLDGDPNARLLAYGEGDDIDTDDEAAAKKALPAEKKQADRPADKKRAPAADKSK